MCFDPATNLTRTVFQSNYMYGQPTSIAWEPSGNLLIGMYFNSIYRLNTETGEITGLGGADAYVAAIDVGEDGAIYAGLSMRDGSAPNVSRFDPVTGVRTIVSEGGMISRPWTLAVYPVVDFTGPAISDIQITPNPAAVGVGTRLTAVASDQSTGGSLIALAEYNVDGGPFKSLAAADGTLDCPLESVVAGLDAWSTPTLHTVCVRAKDTAGSLGASECSLLAVYDPNGGFVTGSGAVDVGAGMDLDSPSASGCGTFAFVAKYHKGQSTPDGNLGFRFKAGDLIFDSTRMDWLVVTGEPRAIFRGEGRLNNASTCKFEVDAWAGSFGQAPGDAFGLKLYSCSNGKDRLHLPAVPLSEGSIKIHK